MTVTGKQTVSISKKAVKSLQSTVDKQEHKTCNLKLRIAEKKCQTVFSFSEWILNRASKWHVQVPVIQRSVPKWRKQCCLPVQAAAATHHLDPLESINLPSTRGRLNTLGQGGSVLPLLGHGTKRFPKTQRRCPFLGRPPS